MSVLSADVIDFGQLYTSTEGRTGISRVTARDVWFPGVDVLSGAVTDTQPEAAQPALAFNGLIVGGVNDFLYGHIYLFPSNLALGNLVSEETRPLNIWNATFAPADITAVVQTGTTGLTLTAPFSPPYTLAPLQEAQYEVAVSLDGPASLSAAYTFTVGGMDYTVQVSGTRVVIWPFRPSWDQQVNELLEWQTDVMTSYTGMEQRVALREQPRRKLDYNFVVLRTDTQHFDNILFGWQNHPFSVPLWPYKCKLTTNILSGTLSLPVNTIDSGFVVGQTVTLFRSVDEFEVIEIASVTDSSIGLKSAVLNDWSAGELVYPSGVAVLEGNVATTRMTGIALTGGCTFVFSPSTVDPFIPEATADTIYAGYEVVTYQMDWSNNIDNPQMYNLSVVDFGIGDRVLTLTEQMPKSQRGFRWIMKNRNAVRKFREFLGRRKGQQVACFIPSWNQNMTVTQPMLTGSVTLQVRDRNFFTLIGQNPHLAHIMIALRTGEIYYRPIQQVGKTGSDLQINISTALPLDVQPENVRGVYYLQLWRLATDLVTLQWQTDQVAIADLVLQLAPS